MDQRDKGRIVWNLKSLPNEIDDLVADLDEQTLRWSPIPGKWSILELICHLRDVERTAFLERYQRMLSEENPFFHEIDQNRLAVIGDYKSQDAAAVRRELKQLRGQTVALLESLAVEQWGRSGRHDRVGPISIEELAIRQKDHDLNHLLQIKDIVRLKMPW